MKAITLFAAIAANAVFILPASAGGGATTAPGYLAPLADYGCNGRCIVRDIEMHRLALAHRSPRRFERASPHSWQ
jgi:hypothetical protein